jgi:hypothetical protein
MRWLRRLPFALSVFWNALHGSETSIVQGYSVPVGERVNDGKPWVEVVDASPTTVTVRTHPGYDDPRNQEENPFRAILPADRKKIRAIFAAYLAAK